MAFEFITQYLPSNPYLQAGAIFVISFLVMWLVLFVFNKVFLRLAKNTKTKVDDIIVQKTRYPFAVLALLVGVRIAVETLSIAGNTGVIIEGIINSLIILSVTRVIVVIMDAVLESWGMSLAQRTKSSTDDDLIMLFKRIVKVILYIIGLMYVLMAWGIEIGPFIASLGIAGVAVAFALQNTLGNIFGGISLILDKTFRVGDVIQLHDGSLGTVEKVSIRSTKIRTFDNEMVTVPNGKLADSNITNWHMPDMKVRITVDFGVEYGAKPEKVKEIVMGVVKQDKELLKDPEPSVLFKNLGDSSLNFMARFWIEDISNKLTTKDRMTEAIYNSLNKNKIGIPFPQMDVHIKK